MKMTGKKAKNAGLIAMIMLCLAVIGGAAWQAEERFGRTQAAAAPASYTAIEKEETNQTRLEQGEIHYAKGTFFWNGELECWETAKMDCYVVEKETAVRAIRDGEVKKTSFSVLEGGCVVIEHENGDRSAYQGLGRTLLVREGQQVKSGDVLGEAMETQVFFSFDSAREEEIEQ